jgi:hypothetical protein
VIVGVAIAVVVSVALVMGFLIVRDMIASFSWREPEFASLAESPDSSLQGTVAYLADQSGCVRIVAAAGQPSKDVLCLPGRDMSKAEKEGKEIGLQLVWLPDGRLELTMFRMTSAHSN